MLKRSRNRTPTLVSEISLPHNVYQTKCRRNLRCISSNRLQILSVHSERQGRARPAERRYGEQAQMTPDLINAVFELSGAALTWLSVARLYRDKKVRGV